MEATLPATEDEAWEKLSITLTTELQAKNSKYVNC